MKAFRTLLKIEWKLSVRDMNMIIFAICMPVVVIGIIGMIYGNKPAFDGANHSFLAQSFGAISSIAICAGGLMGLPIVLADYREKKILKRFKVTPTSPIILLLVELVIYAIYSIIALILVYAVAEVFWKFKIEGSILQFLGSYFLVMISMFSIGMMVGGIAKDSKSAGAIASILYFPMLIFSGATLPYEVMPKILQNVVDILPLTQGIKLLKCAVLGLTIENSIFPIILIGGIFVICFTISIKFFKWE